MSADPQGKAAPHDDRTFLKDRIEELSLASVAAVRTGAQPPDARELHRLRRLLASLPAPDDAADRRRTGALLLCVAVWAAVMLAYGRVSSASVEATVQCSEVEVVFDAARETPLAGEVGEVVPLREVTVAGIESSDPPGDGAGFVRLSTSNQEATAAGALRLMSITVPPRVRDATPSTLRVGVGYSPRGRGVTFQFNATRAVRGEFSELIQVPGVTTPLASPRSFSGRRLELHAFPADTQSELTLVREAPVVSVRFRTDPSSEYPLSTVLGGTLNVSDRPGGPTTLQPGDTVKLGFKHAVLRALTFNGRHIEARVFIDAASTIEVGAGSKPTSLMPTWFAYLLARWPSQSYATLVAIITTVLGLWRLWRNPS